MFEKILNFYIWVSIAHLRCGLKDYNDYNINFGSFQNRILVFMLDGDDVGDHCIVCINMQNLSYYEGGRVSDKGNNGTVVIGLKVCVDANTINGCN